MQPASSKSTNVQKELTTIDYLNAADKFWLGEQLNAARLFRGLDIPAAARQLDLSQAQVMAIETGSQGPFLHIAHYIQSVRSFAASMNTPHSSEVLNWLECREEHGADKVAVPSHIQRIDEMFRARLANDMALPVSASRFNRIGSIGVSFALIVLGFLITLPHMWDVDHTENSVADHKVALQQTAVLLALNSDSPSVEKAHKPVGQVAITDDLVEFDPLDSVTQNIEISETGVSTSKVLSLEFTAPCWVQVTSHDGRVMDRVYESAELLELDLQKTESLVIGNVNGAKAMIGLDSQVDFSAFVAGGNVARLKVKDLVKLTERGDQAAQTL
jgi:hypothetical protein